MLRPARSRPFRSLYVDCSVKHVPGSPTAEAVSSIAASRGLCAHGSWMQTQQVISSALTSDGFVKNRTLTLEGTINAAFAKPRDSASIVLRKEAA